MNGHSNPTAGRAVESLHIQNGGGDASTSLPRAAWPMTDKSAHVPSGEFAHLRHITGECPLESTAAAHKFTQRGRT